jgi:hypothetical protein
VNRFAPRVAGCDGQIWSETVARVVAAGLRREGRLKAMLNSDEEIEDQMTAGIRIVALSHSPITSFMQQLM